MNDSNKNFDTLFNKLFKKVDEPDMSGDQKYVRKLLIEKVDEKHQTGSWQHIGELIEDFTFSIKAFTYSIDENSQIIDFSLKDLNKIKD